MGTLNHLPPVHNRRTNTSPFNRNLKLRTLMVREKFNTGPTPRHAILDFIHLLDEHPEVWARID